MRSFGRHWFCLGVYFLATAAASSARADKVVVDTVLTGLNRPCGVAVQPGGSTTRYQVFVADTAAGRIIRMASDAPGQSADVIIGFATGPNARRPVEQAGPRGLLFLGANRLVVARSEESGGELLAYGVPDDAKTLPADQSSQELKFPSGGSSYALTRTRANERVADSLVVAAAKDSERGRLLQCRVQVDFLGDLQPFGGPQSTDDRTSVTVTTSAQGYLVVGRTPKRGASPRSAISFHNPIDGAEIMTLATELHEIMGLAYSPISGNLYAVDFAGAAPGVYRIDDASRSGEPACRAVKITDVRRPTALAFGPDGTLYVTNFGDADHQGTLVKITGKL